MRKLLFLFALFFVIPPQPVLAEASDIGAVSRSVVRVAILAEYDGQRKLIGHGSGVVIAPDKIITNAHVVEEATYSDNMTILVIPSQGTQIYSAKLIDWSPENDLALLQLGDDAKLIPASIYTGVITDGADVFAIGYPANVDIAMDLNEADTLRPQAPVKTRGSISSGRSAKSFDSLLHTAPIAPGNSGGPLVDACGRIIGINSFGSAAENGGAEFYFAVSTRELSAYLRKENIQFNGIGSECRSVAELTRAEAEMEAADRAKIDTQNRLAAELRQKIEGKSRREAELKIIASRENRIMLAALMLILAVGGAGASFWLFEHKHRNPGIGSATGSAFLVIGALFIFLTRPSFDQVDELVKIALRAAEQGEDPGTPVTKEISGKQICVIQLERSKITVSSTADVAFDWKPDGCVNGNTQYVRQDGYWSRSFVPNDDAQVSIVHYSPESQIYRIERYLLGMNAMGTARTARQNFNVKSCSTKSTVQEKIANMNNAVRDILPTQPNELLLFKCTTAPTP